MFDLVAADWRLSQLGCQKRSRAQTQGGESKRRVTGTSGDANGCTREKEVLVVVAAAEGVTNTGGGVRAHSAAAGHMGACRSLDMDWLETRDELTKVSEYRVGAFEKVFRVLMWDEIYPRQRVAVRGAPLGVESHTTLTG